MISSDEWKRRFIKRIVERSSASEDIAREVFDAGNYTLQEMIENTPEEMADEELSNWVNDEG